MDDLGFVEAVDRFGESIVVAIADTADRRFNPGFGQALGVLDGHVLRTPVGMMHQTAAMGRLPFVQSLLQRSENEACMGRPAHPPSDDTARIRVDDKGDID